MNPWLLVYAIGAAQGALLGVALWRRSDAASSGRVLAVWVALITVDLAVRAAYVADPGPGLLKPFRLVALFPFLHASAFYLYLRTLTRQARPRLRDLWHFAGFALAVLAYADLLLLDAAGTQALHDDLVAGRFPERARYVDWAMMLHGLVYVSAGLAQTQRYRRVLLAQRSDVAPAALRWLAALAVSQVVIWSLAFAQWLGLVPGVGYRLIYVAVAAWVFLVGYFSLAQPPEPALPRPEPEPESPADAGAEDGRFDEVAMRLETLMSGQARYREPALTIGQLARRSGYPEYLVSAVINRRHGCHFWDYVNRHRIEAARSRLADPDENRTVLDIAYDVGFTAKSTFNAAFKRQLGQTPGEYRRRCAAEHAASARRAQD